MSESNQSSEQPTENDEGRPEKDDEIEDLDALVDEVADVFHIASEKIEDGTLTRPEKKAVAIAGRCFQNYQDLQDLLDGADQPEGDDE